MDGLGPTAIIKNQYNGYAYEIKCDDGTTLSAEIINAPEVPAENRQETFLRSDVTVKNGWKMIKPASVADNE